MGALKEAFAKNNHPRGKKEFAVSRHQPFGKTSNYTSVIRNANYEKRQTNKNSWNATSDKNLPVPVN